MIILILLLLLMRGSVEAATYWVSSSQGTDAGTTCTSSASPPSAYLRTIARGITCLGAQDTLNIRGGIYNEDINGTQFTGKNGTGFTSGPTGLTGWSGAAGTPTTIRAYQTEIVQMNKIIFGADGIDARYIVFEGDRAAKNFVVRQGLVIGNSTGTLVVHHLKFDGIDFGNSNNELVLTLTRCRPGQCEVPSGSFNSDIHHIWITNSKVHHINPNISVENTYGMYQSGANDLVFEFNEMYNITGYGIHQIFGDNLRNTYRYNYFHDIGISTNTNTPFLPYAQVIHISGEPTDLANTGRFTAFYSNVLVENRGAISIVTRDNEIYNNTVYHTGNGRVTCVLAGHNLCGPAISIDGQSIYGISMIRNNIVYNNYTNTIQDDGKSPSTISKNFMTDPRFVDVANAKYDLCTGVNQPQTPCPGASGAINYGDTLSSPYNVDILGSVRPPGQFDAGAYEAGGLGSPVVNISASPVTITSGQSSDLTWTTTNTTSCAASASPSNGQWTGSKALSGKQTITNITVTTTFILTCDGVAQSTTVTISVVLPVVNISANPSTVNAGGSSTLTWSTTSATSCVSSTSPPSANSDWPESGSQATSGNKTISVINATTEFWLDCSNGFGTTSQSVIVTIAPSCPTAPAQVVKMGMDETSGLPQDASAFSNHMTALGSGNALAPSGGKYGGGVTYGGSARSTIANANSLWLCNSWTWMAWIKPSSTSSTFRAVLSKSSPPSNPNDLYAYADSSYCANSGPIAGYGQGGQSVYACYGVAAAVPASPTWTHLAMTYDRTLSSSNVKLYLNGNLVTTANGQTILDQTSGPLYIGGSEYGEFFSGTIDELKGWNTALSAAEITTEMNTPINPVAPSGTPVDLKVSAITRKIAGGVTIKKGMK